MKRTVLFVFALVVLAGSAFAFGQKDKSAGQNRVADVADLAEVPDVPYAPRRNPAIGRAEGAVFAWPATPLRPEAEQLPAPVFAISGVKGQEIRETNGPTGAAEVVDIVVVLPEKEKFIRGLTEGTDVSDWIDNLPAGLEARAHRVKINDTQIKMYVSGTPTVTSRNVVRVNIPASFLAGGTARRFVSPTEEESLKTWEATQTGAQGANN